jgi:hypothetical protein
MSGEDMHDYWQERIDRGDLTDLGEGHWINFTEHGGVRVGLIDIHAGKDGRLHAGGVHFDMPEAVGTARWTVNSMEPLDLSPSLLCSCGDHGYIKGGKWVSA